MSASAPSTIVGLDFGTTNSVAAIARGAEATLVPLQGPNGSDPVFRSALCFWEEEPRLEVEAGPWAIAEYLDCPAASRFIQSFKSVAASRIFEDARIFNRRFRFEDLGQTFVEKMSQRSGGLLDGGAARLVVGRPVAYAGHQPDEVLARQRYDAVFGSLGSEVFYVYEPMGAAFSFAAGISEPATVLVADFGGGTSDFSVVQIAAPGATKRCVPLGHAGIGVAGDTFDFRILDNLVMPLLGKGGTFRSFGKELDIPAGYFSDFSDWSRLAFMRNRKTLSALDKLRRVATDPVPIERMIAVVDQELGYRLYEAVGQVKRDLSSTEAAQFRFNGAGLSIEAEVTRTAFEGWISPDLERIGRTLDRAMSSAGVGPADIDRVFLTGGSSLIPRIRQLFAERFGAGRIATGGELTSIAHGLALIGAEDNPAAWAA